MNNFLIKRHSLLEAVTSVHTKNKKTEFFSPAGELETEKKTFFDLWSSQSTDRDSSPVPIFIYLKGKP